MPSTDITEAQFRELFDAASNWGRWPGNGGRGALNHLTPARIAAAARLVETGVTVTLSQVLCTEARIDVPAPADHHTTLLTDVDIGSGSVRFAKDYVGVDHHNDGHTHIDAFSHVAFDGSFFDGQAGALHILKDGLVGRGVLLDVPTVRGVLWLEPGEHVRPADLAAAEREQGATVGPDDILRLRTGHTRQAELEPWDTGRAKAGLHPTTASFLADRQVGALGSDGNSDTAPSTTDGIGFPMHVLAINAMGIHLLDYLQFEDLAGECEEQGRWEFLLVAPLRVHGGTGSPVNPIAVV